MSRYRAIAPARVVLVTGLLLLLRSASVGAHCDSLDGPVVQAAREALKTENVDLVLGWVAEGAEAEIRRVFEQTLVVRELNAAAKDLADVHFFETLVRLHRAGEGAPYTGLKPEGTILPAITAADQALAGGSVDALAERLAGKISESVKERFAAVQEAKRHVNEGVQARRQHVRAYVEYVHFVEGVHDLVSHGSKGHRE